MVSLKKQNYIENKKIFNCIEKELRKYLDNTIKIEHVGSTAIKNMYGKNIIDILIGAKNKEEFNYINNILENNMKYIASKKSKDSEYQFFSSIAGETSSGDIHVHVALENTDRYNDFLILREYLLSNKEEAKKYSDVKRKIISLGIEDRREYKKIKTKYVSDLLNKIKSELNYR